MKISQLIILLGFLSACSIVSAQRKFGLEANNWATELSKGGLNEVNSMGSLSIQLMAADSIHVLRFLDSVEASSGANGYFFRSHFCMIKAKFLYDKFLGYDLYKKTELPKVKRIKEQMMKLYADAIDAAYHTEDERTIGWVCFYSAKLMRNLGETGWAVMYSKSGVDLFEKAGYVVEPTVYTDLADLLYQVKEYDECIIYAKKGIQAWRTVTDESEIPNGYKYKIKALNLIGLVNYEKHQYDSALAYYQQALIIAKANNDTVWSGTVLGNTGRILFTQNKLDTAHALFTTNYHNSKQHGIYNDAANALQWVARANLARGKNTEALAAAREAIQLLTPWPKGPYLRDTYFTLTQVFRALSQYDSAFYYSERYIALNDSLEKEVVTSSLAISKAKLNDEVSRFNIEKLNRQKNAELLWRNIIIVSIVILSLVALLIINRQLLKEKIKTEKAQQDKERIEHEKLLMEQEMHAAKDQLKMFTANIVEKANLIEKLEQQIKGKEATAEQHAIITELSQQTILTEDTWNKFKLLFEKVYPAFFIKLTEQFSDITLAEQRMAALIRLRLTPNQMASMLGISVDSVHKSRQRLRQRFQVEAGANLNELVANF